MFTLRSSILVKIVFIAVFALFFAGCQQPTPRVAQEIFVEKPSVAPTSVRSYAEIQSCFNNRNDGNDSWEYITLSGPSFLREVAAKEPPLPGTPWYEYLRCGRDFSSKVDKVIFDEYKKSCKNPTINDINAALRRLVVGTMAFELGFLKEAQRHFLEAVWWMEEATDKNLESKAATGRSDIKIYKGDAYERAMVHFYLGMIAYELGEFQEARREFSRAIQADCSKPAENMRGKFALLHYWLGKTYLHLGDISNARVAMAKAKESGLGAEEILFNIDAIQNANLTILVQVGCGPTRILKGADWQHSEYKATDFLECGCDIFIDGELVGKAHLLADAWQQVSTSGISEEQKLQSSKGLAKGVLQVMPYISLLAVSWDVRGDIRSWSVLPGRILVWTGRVSPGEHTITLKFYDSDDYEMVKYRQTWYFIPTYMDGETVILLRSGRDKCNMGGKEN